MVHPSNPRAGLRAQVYRLEPLLVDPTITALIIIPILFGAVLAVVNHVIFAHLNGSTPFTIHRLRGLGAYYISPQVENTIATSLANATKLTLGISIVTSLTQVMWRLARTRELTLGHFDDVFGLPNVMPLYNLTLRGKYLPALLPIILVALAHQALEVLMSFAPGSLVVTLSQGSLREFVVPTVNLAAPPVHLVNVYSDPGLTQPSFQQDSDVVYAMTFGSLAPQWFAPRGCGTTCKYILSYTAPALACAELSTDQISAQPGNDSAFPVALANWTLGHASDSAFVYNASTNLPPPGQSANVSEPYALNVAFLPPDDLPQGASCVFYSAQYSISTLFDSVLGQTTDVNVVFRGSNLSDPWAQPDGSCPWTFNPSPGVDSTGATFPSCMNEGINARAMVLGFLNVLRGTMRWPSDDWNSTAYLAPIFNIDVINQNISLSDPSATLSESLEMLMRNMTLASFYRQIVTDDVRGIADINESVYGYDRLRFWLTYGLALLFTTACGSYGLFALRKNRRPGTLKLSQFISAAQNPALSAFALGQDSKQLSEEQRRVTVKLSDGLVREDNPQRIVAFDLVWEDTPATSSAYAMTDVIVPSLGVNNGPDGPGLRPGHSPDGGEKALGTDSRSITITSDASVASAREGAPPVRQRSLTIRAPAPHE